MFCIMYVANNSSILQYCHGMSIEGVDVFYHTTEYANSWEEGGSLTARRKRKSSLLCPPPLFPESRSQKGGGVTAGQYGITFPMEQHPHTKIARILSTYAIMRKILEFLLNGISQPPLMAKVLVMSLW